MVYAVRMTHDENKTDYVPATVDEVHLPGDVLKRDWDAVDEYDAVKRGR